MKQLAILCFLFTSTLNASIPLTIPPGKWQCLAFDEQQHSFPGIGNNTRVAMIAARRLCRHQSKARLSCQTAQSYCEQGPLSLIENRCVVSDSKGHYWNTTGKSSCRVAMKLCTQWQYLHGRATQCSVKHRL